MALKADYLNYIVNAAESCLGTLSGRQMLELGNQKIKASGVREKTGKAFFSKKGAFHTSVDLNGLDGAIPVDLAKPDAAPEWAGRFDIITNAGTTEHVEPWQAQYECFRNIHRWLKVGGISVHLVPDVRELDEKGSWAYHCNNYYSENFFRMLAAENQYELASFTIMDGLACACVRKTAPRPFTGDRENFLKHVARRQGAAVYPGLRLPFLNRLSEPAYRLWYGLCRLIRRWPGNSGTKSA